MSTALLSEGYRRITRIFDDIPYQLYAPFTRASKLTEHDQILIDGPPEPCVNLTDSTSATITLPDRRKIGYAQYGVPDGIPILYLHGLPGSRVEAMGLEAAAIKYGARIVAIDRPGMGWSSPRPNRTILDHAKDVEIVANHLSIHDYGIMGISGGGPYALACARVFSTSKLKAVSIMCGLGPPDLGYRGVNLLQYVGFSFVLRYFPSIVAWYISFDPAARLDLSDQERYERIKALNPKSKAHPKDRPFMDDLDLMRQTLKMTREAYGQGMQYYARDGQLMVNDWGFKIEDIRKSLPVRLWYGKLDTNVPPAHGEQIARRLGDNAALRMEDETHSSLYVNCREEMVKDLVECIRKSL